MFFDVGQDFLFLSTAGRREMMGFFGGAYADMPHGCLSGVL
jgi:hypothetical protein